MPNPTITLEIVIAAPMNKVWQCWTDPTHIVQWNQASADWHSPRAENDAQAGGKFNIRMEAKDGSQGFDFAGTYTDVIRNERIAYVLDDGRHVTVVFSPSVKGIRLTQTFEMETQNSEELQRAGWQAILENFKRYVEKH